MATSKKTAADNKTASKTIKGKATTTKVRARSEKAAPAPNPNTSTEIVSQKAYKERMRRLLHLGTEHMAAETNRLAGKDGTRFASVVRTTQTVTSDGVLDTGMTVSSMKATKIPAQDVQDGFKRHMSWKGVMGNTYVRLSWKKTNGKDKNGKPIMLPVNKQVAYISIGNEERVVIKSIDAIMKLVNAANAVTA